MARLALRYLHRKCPPVVHGDLKHSNVMIETRALKHGGSFFQARLLEFGWSRVPSDRAKPLGGTMRWCAPEVFNQSVPLPSATAALPYPTHYHVEVPRMAVRPFLLSSGG